MKSLQKQVDKFHHWIFKIFNFTHNVSKFYIFRCDLVNLFASILFFFLFILRSSNKNKACEKAIKAFELRAPVSVHVHTISAHRYWLLTQPPSILPDDDNCARHFVKLFFVLYQFLFKLTIAILFSHIFIRTRCAESAE